MNNEDWFPLGLTGLSPCSPRDSQESPPTSQFKGISSSVFRFLYSPTLTSIHNYWKNHSFVSKVMPLLFHILFGLVIVFSSKKQASFNFMAAVIICNDFGGHENKISHCFHCFLIYLTWSDRTGCHDLCFFECWVLSQFFTLFFHFHQEVL